jgi:sugar phosphate isomerase/epimerase
MKFAVSTWNYSSYLKAGFPFSRMMEEISSRDLGIEFWLATLSDEQISQYVEHFKGTFPLVSCHTSQANSFSEEILKNEIALCPRLGAKILVVHPVSLGFTAHTWDYSYEKPFDAALFSRLERYLSLAAEHGVMLALENGPMKVLEDVVDYVVKKNLRDNLGICVDTGHASMHMDRDPENVLKHLGTFRDHLLQLHIHDNQGKTDDHIIPGRGRISWPEVMAILGEKKQSLPFVFELKTQGAPMAAVSESIRFMSRF